MVELPLAPLPSARHSLEMTPRLVVPSVTFATRAALSANPRCPRASSLVATPAPRVQASRRPTEMTPGTGRIEPPCDGHTDPDWRRPEPMGPKPSTGSAADPCTAGDGATPPMRRGPPPPGLLLPTGRLVASASESSRAFSLAHVAQHCMSRQRMPVCGRAVPEGTDRRNTNRRCEPRAGMGPPAPAGGSRAPAPTSPMYTAGEALRTEISAVFRRGGRRGRTGGRRTWP
jgi:hypothetical protein